MSLENEMKRWFAKNEREIASDDVMIQNERDAEDVAILQGRIREDQCLQEEREKEDRIRNAQRTYNGDRELGMLVRQYHGRATEPDIEPGRDSASSVPPRSLFNPENEYHEGSKPRIQDDGDDAGQSFSPNATATEEITYLHPPPHRQLRSQRQRRPPQSDLVVRLYKRDVKRSDIVFQIKSAQIAIGQYTETGYYVIDCPWCQSSFPNRQDPLRSYLSHITAKHNSEASCNGFDLSDVVMYCCTKIVDADEKWYGDREAERCSGRKRQQTSPASPTPKRRCNYDSDLSSNLDDDAEDVDEGHKTANMEQMREDNNRNSGNKQAFSSQAIAPGAILGHGCQTLHPSPEKQSQHMTILGEEDTSPPRSRSTVDGGMLKQGTCYNLVGNVQASSSGLNKASESVSSTGHSRKQIKMNSSKPWQEAHYTQDLSSKLSTRIEGKLKRVAEIGKESHGAQNESTRNVHDVPNPTGGLSQRNYPPVSFDLDSEVCMRKDTTNTLHQKSNLVKNNDNDRTSTFALPLKKTLTLGSPILGFKNRQSEHPRQREKELVSPLDRSPTSAIVPRTSQEVIGFSTHHRHSWPAEDGLNTSKSTIVNEKPATLSRNTESCPSQTSSHHLPGEAMSRAAQFPQLVSSNPVPIASSYQKMKSSNHDPRQSRAQASQKGPKIARFPIPSSNSISTAPLTRHVEPAKEENSNLNRAQDLERRNASQLWQTLQASKPAQSEGDDHALAHGDRKENDDAAGAVKEKRMPVP